MKNKCRKLYCFVIDTLKKYKVIKYTTNFVQNFVHTK